MNIGTKVKFASTYKPLKVYGTPLADRRGEVLAIDEVKSRGPRGRRWTRVEVRWDNNPNPQFHSISELEAVQ